MACRIGMVHQEFKLVRPFTVAENVLLANWRGRFAPGLREVERQIKTQAAELGFAIDPSSRVDELSIAERQRVEIIKVLLAGARILILDEPTAVLTDEEAVRLLTTVRDARRPWRRRRARHPQAWRGDRVHRPGHGDAQRARRRGAQFALDHGQRTDPACGRHHRRSAAPRLVASRRAA